MESLSLVNVPGNPESIPAYLGAVEVVRRLVARGHTAYLVGGGVRDLVLGVPPKDFDVVTSARPEETQAAFSRTIPVGAQFGVVTVRHGEHSYEVATFRTEGGYSDGRRPDWVEFADLDADLARRDFTINSLVLDPADGRILDRWSGLDDLARGVVRTIGDPTERFREDALRMVRAVRFAARFGFRLDRATRAAIVAGADAVAGVARERIWQELDAMFGDPNRATAFGMLADLGLIAPVLGEEFDADSGEGRSGIVRRLAACAAGAPHAAVWATACADAFAGKGPVRAAWDDDGPQDRKGGRSAAAFLAGLRAPGRLSRLVSGILARRWVWPYSDALRPGALLRLLRSDRDGSLLAFWQADARAAGRADVAERLERAAAGLRAAGRTLDGPEAPPVDGDVLAAHGIPAGPRVRALLAEAERLWLAGALENRDAIQRWLDTARA